MTPQNIDKPLSTQFILILAIISVATSSLLFLLNGYSGIGLRDEGFLWYGSQRVIAGEIPIKDFMAYDPLRYFWSATWMAYIGDGGIISLRASVAAFQSIGFFSALFLIYKHNPQSNRLQIILTILILAAWMFPRHKLFDISISIILVAILSYLIEKPCFKRYFISGFVIGMAAGFGKNHGVYGAWGLLVTLAYLTIFDFKLEKLTKNIGYSIAGGFIGFSPILVLSVFDPDFFTAFWDGIIFLFKIKATNHPLPIPWPWLVEAERLPWSIAIRYVLIGTAFVLLVIASVIGLIYPLILKLKQTPLPPQIVASLFMILPYTHFATSRADIAHLAQGIYPLLICIFISIGQLKTTYKLAISSLLLISSLSVMLPAQPFWQAKQQGNWTTVSILDDDLLLPPRAEAQINLFQNLEREFAPNGQAFLAIPFLPGAYAVLERKSPIWEIYALAEHRNDDFQKLEVNRIENADPEFIVILDVNIDGRDELRFMNSRPIIRDYIMENFTPNNDFDAPPQYKIYTKK